MTAACRYCGKTGSVGHPIEHACDCPITTGKGPLHCRVRIGRRQVDEGQDGDAIMVRQMGSRVVQVRRP